MLTKNLNYNAFQWYKIPFQYMWADGYWVTRFPKDNHDHPTSIEL